MDPDLLVILLNHNMLLNAFNEYNTNVEGYINEENDEQSETVATTLSKTTNELVRNLG
jgi:hypothetical protein